MIDPNALKAICLILASIAAWMNTGVILTIFGIVLQKVST